MPQPQVDSASGTPTVRSVARALEALEALARSERPMTLSELSRALAIPKSTLLGILRTMDHAGWLDESDGRFSLGVRSLLTGSSFVESDPVLLVVQPWLDHIATELGETVHLGRLDRGDVVYLAKRESRHPLRMFSAIGRRLPAHATALGKSILAQLDQAQVRDAVGPEPVRLTAKTLVEHADLVADLEDIRARGWASDKEENAEGIHCFAVDLPLSTTSRNAISVSIPVYRLTPEVEEHAVSLLLEARTQLLRRGIPAQ